MLTIKDGKLYIKASDLLLASFLKAYSQDKTAGKEEVTKLFSYIHLRSQIDPDAPFYRASQLEIEALAKREIYRDVNYNWKGSIYKPAQVEELLNDYKLAYMTPEQIILREYDNKIYESNVLLSETKPKISENTNPKDSRVTYTTNYGIIQTILTGIEKIITARDALLAKIKKEGDKGAVRGQQTLSYLEKKHDK